MPTTPLPTHVHVLLFILYTDGKYWRKNIMSIVHFRIRRSYYARTASCRDQSALSHPLAEFQIFNIKYISRICIIKRVRDDR